MLGPPVSEQSISRPAGALFENHAASGSRQAYMLGPQEGVWSRREFGPVHRQLLIATIVAAGDVLAVVAAAAAHAAAVAGCELLLVAGSW